MRRFHRGWLCLLLGALFIAAGAKPDDNQAVLLKALREVEREGTGHRAAKQAWDQLTANVGADHLPALLAAIDGASPLAANWLRAAVDTIAERQLMRDGNLPIAELEKFLQQKQHDPRARRLAFEWITRVDATALDRLIPGMLDDPSLELRRDAVAQVLTTAEKALAENKADEAIYAYQKALQSARDSDQVMTTTEALKKLGQPVDLARQFGFLQDWKLLGPFDNRQEKGFAVAYPPEIGVNFSAKYPTPSGTIGWVTYHTDNEHGFIDLNQALGKHANAVAYAAAEFHCDRPGPVELRLGADHANKIWLNGKLLFSAEVYHSNVAIDQYTGRGELRKGRNLILLKICQNDQPEEWAQEWKFQLRVCDSIGTAILSTDRPPSRAPGIPTAGQESKE